MNRIARWWGRVQAVLSWGLEAGLAELPRACDWGMKRNSHGSLERWRGYRLHLDVCDPGLPLSAQTTSASLHDSQVAIPMARETAWRVTALYEEVVSKLEVRGIRVSRMSAVVHRQDADATAP